MSFHTTLPEDRCVRLLVKNLGRSMPESVVRNELESLNFRVRGVTQLRSGRRDQDLAKDRPPTPHFIISVARGPEVSKVRTLRLASVGGVVRGSERPAAMQALPTLRPYAAQLRIRTTVRRLWGLPSHR